MNAKTIMMAMTAVLFALFFLVKPYRKKEEHKGKLEGDYFEALQKYRSNTSDENKEAYIVAARAYAECLGHSADKVEAMISKDLSL